MPTVNPPTRRARILFVAALTPMSGGGHGGQLTAALTILHSQLSERVEFIPLSSTMESIPPPGLPRRAMAAALRMREFVRQLPHVDGVLIFISDGLSLLEKGLMVITARLAGRATVVRFGSGNLAAQCDDSPSLRTFLRQVLRSSHVVVSQGARWSRYFESYSEAFGKVMEIPNGIEVGAPATSKQGRANVIFVGWMHREKGIFDILDTVVGVRQRVPNARFEFVGGGRDLATFRDEVRRRGLGNLVTASGWLPHEAAVQRLRSADVFVLPSQAEGLPNALLEAMASGLPVVATAVGSIGDVLRNGETGLLVPFHDPRALEAALVELLSDEARARALGANGRRLMLEHNDIRSLWRRYGQALARACQEAGSAVSIDTSAVDGA